MSDFGSALHDAGDVATALREAIMEFRRAVAKGPHGHVSLRDPITPAPDRSTAFVTGGTTIVIGVNLRRDALAEIRDPARMGGAALYVF